MADSVIAKVLKSVFLAMHPRRSLVAGAMWLIIGLAATFSIAAAVWVGGIARENVLEQHVRRLSLETDQLSSDLGQALAARLDAIRAAGRILQATSNRPNGLSDVFNELVSVYPQFDWIAVADPDGVVRSTNGGLREGSEVGGSRWFAAGLQGPWLGVIGDGQARTNRVETSATSSASNTAALGDMAAPVRDETGRVVGVIAARLSWRRAPHHPERLTDESDPHGVTLAYVLDKEGIVLVGPDDIRNQRWNGAPIEVSDLPSLEGDAPRFERLPNGRRVLVSRATLSAGSEVSSLDWQVQLCEPRERVYQRANALTLKILWVSMCLGAATCLLGVLGARQLTGRLKRLTRSVASVGDDADAQIEIPGGIDEVAQLAQAFAKILGALQRERRELKTLSSELERRVAVRTREVERLAEESRYAAIVRERLKIARDLHDTLAHSMMAILSEIRFLRRLQSSRSLRRSPTSSRAPRKWPTRGCKEARTAITSDARQRGARDGPGSGARRTSSRGSSTVRASPASSIADGEAARFGDERAETLLRMAQEALA
jgi:signal transduction histidine kinase